jgi:hypothetical protein
MPERFWGLLELLRDLIEIARYSKLVHLSTKVFNLVNLMFKIVVGHFNLIFVVWLRYFSAKSL